MRGIHRSPVNSPHKDQWRWALVFSLICAWINGWVNNNEVGDLRHHRAHYDVIVSMLLWHWRPCTNDFMLNNIININSFFCLNNAVIGICYYTYIYCCLYLVCHQPTSFSLLDSGNQTISYNPIQPRKLLQVKYFPKIINTFHFSCLGTCHFTHIFLSKTSPILGQTSSVTPRLVIWVNKTLDNIGTCDMSTNQIKTKSCLHFLWDSVAHCRSTWVFVFVVPWNTLVCSSVSRQTYKSMA